MLLATTVFELNAAAIFLAGLTVLVSLGAGITSIWANTRPNPPNHQQYAAKHDLERVEVRVERVEVKMTSAVEDLRREIAGTYKEMQRSDESRSSNIHNRLNKIDRELASIAGRLGVKTQEGDS